MPAIYRILILVAISIFALWQVVAATDKYVLNPFSSKLDNIGDAVKYGGYSRTIRQNNDAFKNFTSKDRVTASILAEYTAHQSKTNNPHSTTAAQVGAPTYSDYSAHKYSLAPAHPAGGSDKSVQINAKGVQTGAAFLNYTGSMLRVGNTTLTPSAKLHCVSDDATTAVNHCARISNSYYTKGAQASLAFTGKHPTTGAEYTGAYVGAVFNNPSTSKVTAVFSTASTATNANGDTAFSYKIGGISKSNFLNNGVQQWLLYGTNGGIGTIQYSVPSGSPGIRIQTGAAFDQNIMNVLHAGKYLAMNFQNYAGQYIFPNGVGINTILPMASLNVKSAASAVVVASAGVSDKNSVRVAGTYSGTVPATYIVQIDGVGSPNTFQWNKNGGAYTTGVSITGSAQTLSDGLTINFQSTTGFTLNNTWTLHAGRAFKVENSATTPLFEVHNNGNVIIGTAGTRAVGQSMTTPIGEKLMLFRNISTIPYGAIVEPDPNRDDYVRTARSNSDSPVGILFSNYTGVRGSNAPANSWSWVQHSGYATVKGDSSCVRGQYAYQGTTSGTANCSDVSSAVRHNGEIGNVGSNPSGGLMRVFMHFNYILPFGIGAWRLRKREEWEEWE